MRGVILASALAVGLLTAACSSGEAAEPTATPTPGVHRAYGQITLHGRAARKATPVLNGLAKATWHQQVVSGEECSGYGGYDDLREGMEIRLESDGQILSLARLSSGSFGEWQEGEQNYYAMTCTFEFEIDVPAGHDFYTIVLGNRGDHTYTYEEITASDTLAYEIGR